MIINRRDLVADTGQRTCYCSSTINLLETARALSGSYPLEAITKP